MTILEALILGVIQGLTEFLPISSTAHLTLVGNAMGLIDDGRPEEWTAFLAVVQVGTLLAVLAYFRHDLWRIARSTLAVARGARPDADARLGGLVVVGTVPIVVAGLALRDVIEGPLTKNLWVIAASLVALALLLLAAERVGQRERGLHQMTVRDALVVGAWQMVALIPGASRSGTTLTGGLFRGLERETAARFSFLLAIPAIAGSAVLQVPQLLDAGGTVDLPAVAFATVASAASGYLAIALMLGFVRRYPTHVFVAYRIGLGALVAGLILSGTLTP